jgi:microcystin-dependent protein
MGCSNCFNGCADIVSDQCVKYTGVDIPGLGISSGDSLLTVENQIINKILELMTGEGTIPVIEPTDLCPLVSSFLPVSGPITLNDVISALFRSVCALDARLNIVEDSLASLNANYVISCLSGVTVDSDTHAILQATIDKLCIVDTDVTLLAADLATNYVLISEIDNYIAAYIASIPSSSLYNSRMVPYTAVPYFGSTVGFFDITGAGIGDWADIYLCNGQNSTPDLRGRALVGNTTMGNTPFNPIVDPGIAGNPTYTQNSTFGANQVPLDNISQLPPHSHTATAIVSPDPHTHTFANTKLAIPKYEAGNDYYPAEIDSTGTTGGTSLSVAVTVGTTGAGTPHLNIQPVWATNYIIYIP